MKTLFTTLTQYIKRHPKVDIAVLCLGLAIFLTITLINAPRASIWFDEAFSAYIAQFSFWDIAQYTASDVHPPFYYWMLKIWSSLFGTTELAYRSLSILFGSGAIVAAFALAKKMFGRRVAWLSLLFMSVSPMLIRYSDEARMYTLVACIVMTATYVMLRAQETGSKKLWATYGVLVSIGMWTHYFTALAWVAHWVWRAVNVWRQKMTFHTFRKAFFTKEWTLTYALAVGVFLPWLPFMAFQLGVVQGGGFWIGPVGVDTPSNYFTNFFYYLEHGQVQSWYALALLVVVITTIIAIPKAYGALRKKERSSFTLIASLAWVPPVLLFLASMPPLQSSFVDRYLIPSVVALSVFLAVVLVAGTRTWQPFWRTLPVVLIVGMMITGITNVYTYGNYNKNSNTHILTRQAVQLVQQHSPEGMPIIANSPWIFYEAAPYSTPEHPIYFIDANTQYNYGSLDMLKKNDLHKIKDITEFARKHPVVWYLANTNDDDVAPYKATWQRLQTKAAVDPLDGSTKYKVTQYRISQ